jgi:gas vesicle protein
MKFIRRVWPYLLLVLFVVAGGGLVIKHDVILDWAVQRSYKPTAAIRQLAAESTMTPYAKQLFYANRPLLESKVAFNKHCANIGDQVSTLGCYTGNRQGIYLYDVTDPRLAGVEQVTAAHEMLHQAYERLNKVQRDHVNSLLQAYYDQLSDAAIKDQIDSYKKSEPGQLLNEMHSIFGTEVSGLPAELETYYQKYFTGRQKVVQYYLQYHSEFEKRRQQVDAYDQQLGTMKTQITNNKTDLQSREKTLKDRRTDLDDYVRTNQIVTYNAAVPGYNALVNAYRAEVSETNDLINRYNQLLGERNAIAVQEQELQQALDSHLDAVNKQ